MNGNFVPSSPEDRLLCARAEDLSAGAIKTCRTAFTKFLTPAQAAMLKNYCRSAGIEVYFDGGRPGAERVVALFFPDWMDPASDESVIYEESPVAVLKISNTGDLELSHRDYLGALMASGIRRDTVGDIDVHGSAAWVFCLREISEYISRELECAGRAKLVIEKAERDDVPPPPKEDGVELYGTVSSLRLDGLIAEGFKLSREEAKLLVTQGACSIDHVPCSKPDAAVEEGSLISVKGKGRLRFDRVRGETRRGRIGVELTVFGKRR